MTAKVTSHTVEVISRVTPDLSGRPAIPPSRTPLRALTPDPRPVRPGCFLARSPARAIAATVGRGHRHRDGDNGSLERTSGELLRHWRQRRRRPRHRGRDRTTTVLRRRSPPDRPWHRPGMQRGAGHQPSGRDGTDEHQEPGGDHQDRCGATISRDLRCRHGSRVVDRHDERSFQPAQHRTGTGQRPLRRHLDLPTRRPDPEAQPSARRRAPPQCFAGGCPSGQLAGGGAGGVRQLSLHLAHGDEVQPATANKSTTGSATATSTVTMPTRGSRDQG